MKRLLAALGAHVWGRQIEPQLPFIASRTNQISRRKVKSFVCLPLKLDALGDDRDGQISWLNFGVALAAHPTVDARCRHVKNLVQRKRLTCTRMSRWIKGNRVTGCAVHAHDVAAETKWTAITRNHEALLGCVLRWITFKLTWPPRSALPLTSHRIGGSGPASSSLPCDADPDL